MALLKSVTNELGIVANYHRIKYLDNNNPELSVRVYSYVSEEYRDTEKSYVSKRELVDKKSKELTDIANTDISEYTIQEQDEHMHKIDELNTEISNLYKELTATDKPYHVFETDITMRTDDVGDISFENIYNYLKSVGTFSGAEDA